MRKREMVWLVTIVLLLGLSFGSAGSKKDAFYPEYHLLAKMVEMVRENYVVPVKDEDLFRGAMEGVVNTLDPYSQYLPPKEAEQLKVETEGKYGGLGIVIAIRDGQLTVITPIEDTPAFKAGVLAGDRILKIEGESTEGITVQQAVNRLRGRPGTYARVLILHEGNRQPVEIKVRRSKIEIHSVKGLHRTPDGHWNFWADEKNKIGYVRITQFQEKTVKEMDVAVEHLLDQGMKALILDLRFNPGGLLNVAIDMADRFVKNGLIVSTKGRIKDSLREYKAHPEDDYPPLPLVVLVNGGSASASEIVSGCIQDWKRGIIVGSRTFGKGSVQSILNLLDDHKLKLTTAHYHTPSGRNIHREKGAKDSDEWGVRPDIEVKLKPQEQRALLDSRSTEEVIRKNGNGKSNGKTEPSASSRKTPGRVPFVDRQLERAVDILKAIDIYQAALRD